MDIWTLKISMEMSPEDGTLETRTAIKKTSTLFAVVRPANTFEVSQVVKIARSLGIPLSMRSGGHSYTCNSIKPGSIHLDMRSLNQIQILDNIIDDSPPDNERKMLKIGSGNTFRQLLKFTGQDTYSYVHGECHSVGVAGFSMGEHMLGYSLRSIVWGMKVFGN